ncbi:MAG: hypothetical protein GXY58_11395 [Planctomycetaceae bacterium]|nr:hypothetical protein [Planctomycetaceae bacterium]
MSDLPTELEFVSEATLTAQQIDAGLANKSLVLWRTDAEGRRWFRRLAILALPVTSNADLDDLSGAGVIRAIPQRKENP